MWLSISQDTVYVNLSTVQTLSIRPHGENLLWSLIAVPVAAYKNSELVIEQQDRDESNDAAMARLQTVRNAILNAEKAGHATYKLPDRNDMADIEDEPLGPPQDAVHAFYRAEDAKGSSRPPKA